MTNKEKQLLLKDLCARLPYGVIVQDRNGTHILTPGNTELGTEYIKPYLRPMSSMTEEERKNVRHFVESHKLGNCSRSGAISDYLNSIHIDYRELIPMGLALEATEGMYKTE